MVEAVSEQPLGIPKGSMCSVGIRRHISYKATRRAPNSHPGEQRRKERPEESGLIRRWITGCDATPDCLRHPQTRVARRRLGLTWIGPHATLDAMKADPAFLGAALVEYEHRLTQLNQAIAEISRRLTAAGEAQPTRDLQAGRKTPLATPRKKRWAEKRKSKRNS